MRILVTGAGGYVARWLVPELRGHDVVGTDQVHRPAWWNDLRYVTSNLLDEHAVSDLLHEHRPDAVVHLAARYGRIQCEERVDRTVRANVEVTTALAQACGATRTRLCYVSSSEVYGESLHPFVAGERPWQDTRPLNLYGWSKLWGEQVAEHYAPVNLVVARLNMPYGPDDPKGVAATGRNVLHVFLWRAHHRRPLVVHRDTTRCLTWIGDVAAGLRKVIENPSSGRYVVCRNDDHRSVRKLAELACEVAGAPTSLIREEPLPPGVTPHKWLDATATYELGWRPTVSLEDGARRTYAWVKNFDERGRWNP